MMHLIERVAAWIMSLTLTQIGLIVGVLILLRLIFQRKRIMSAVRSQLLTLEGIISGAVHAAILIGLFNVWVHWG